MPVRTARFTSKGPEILMDVFDGQYGVVLHKPLGTDVFQALTEAFNEGKRQRAREIQNSIKVDEVG